MEEHHGIISSRETGTYLRSESVNDVLINLETWVENKLMCTSLSLIKLTLILGMTKL